jgi:DNA helicase II / ATP-dependent DNA helicase PcrA
MHLYYTGVENANPYITWDRMDVDIDRTIQEVESVISKIECKNYNMKDIKRKAV